MVTQSRYYSATAQPTVLTSGVTPTNTSISLQAVTGFPASVPFILALDYGTPSEEIVLCTALVGTGATVTRGYDGTSATSHNTGAPVRHTWSAVDGNDSRFHEASTNGVHGILMASAVVGTTDLQSLTNKTLVSPVLTGIVGGTATYNAPTAISISSSTVALVSKGLVGQTGNLQEWQSSTGTVLSNVDGNGAIHAKSGLDAGSADQFTVDSSGNLVTSGGLTGGTVTSTGVMTSGGSLSVTGNVTATGTAKINGMVSAFTENTVGGPVASTSYVDGPSTVSVTVTVPPSGKVMVSGTCNMFQNSTAATFYSVMLVTGSVTGTIRAAADAVALMYNPNNGGNNGTAPGHMSFIVTSANLGETLTIKWQHRVSSGTGGLNLRNISAVPLLG